MLVKEEKKNRGTVVTVNYLNLLLPSKVLSKVEEFLEHILWPAFVSLLLPNKA